MRAHVISGLLLLLAAAVPAAAQEEGDVPADPGQSPSAVTVSWSAGPYAYDGAGNVKSIGSSEKFVYDKLGRLRSGTAGPGRQQDYTYDAYGNLITVTTDQSAATVLRPCVDPATNRISRPMTDCNVNGVYDGKGRVTSYASAFYTFDYDAADVVRETNVNNVRKVHLYNASDERIASIAILNNAPASSEWTIRDQGGRVLRRFSRTAGGAWSWSEDYVYAAGAMLAAEVPGPERTLHFHLDHLGTPRVITGSGGAEIARHTYYPFGREATSATQDGERKKFTGHERDEANLDYMHARYYLPYTGRFLSVDPAGVALDKPQSWNRYSYVLNNPINLVDPDGRAPKKKRRYITPLEALMEAEKEDARLRSQYTEANRKEARRLFNKAVQKANYTATFIASGGLFGVKVKVTVPLTDREAHPEGKVTLTAMTPGGEFGFNTHFDRTAQTYGELFRGISGAADLSFQTDDVIEAVATGVVIKALEGTVGFPRIENDSPEWKAYQDYLTAHPPPLEIKQTCGSCSIQ